MARGTRRSTACPALAAEVLGSLAKTAQKLIELASDVPCRVDALEQHLRALDNPVRQLRQKLQPLLDELIGPTACVLDDPVSLGLGLAANQVHLTLGVAQ